MAPAGRDGSEDRCRQLLDSWERRCRGQGPSEYCSGDDAFFLVTALNSALTLGVHTPELGRAARTWGAQFGIPADALSAIFHLRDALVSFAEDGHRPATVWAPTLAWVFDQVIMEVVDAASANLRSAARIDALTGCANRRALDEELVRTLASARRSGLDMALAVLDLDGLKTINDTKGHPAGDAALVSLVEALRSALRKADTLYRTGGDEFVVLAPFTDAAGAQSLMRRAEQLGGPPFSWGVAGTTSAAFAAHLRELSPAVPGAGEAALASGGTGGGDHSLESEAAALLATADTDLYARRRARRRDQLRARRRRRAAVVASVAASASVTSGAVLAAISGSPSRLSAQGPSGARTSPSGGGTGGTGGGGVGRLFFHSGSPLQTSTPPTSKTHAASSGSASGAAHAPVLSTVSTATVSAAAQDDIATVSVVKRVAPPVPTPVPAVEVSPDSNGVSSKLQPFDLGANGLGNGGGHRAFGALTRPVPPAPTASSTQETPPQGGPDHAAGPPQGGPDHAAGPPQGGPDHAGPVVVPHGRPPYAAPAHGRPDHLGPDHGGPGGPTGGRGAAVPPGHRGD
jgi:GGDEF domain-containing protein